MSQQPSASSTGMNLSSSDGLDTTASGAELSMRHEILRGITIGAPAALGYIPLGLAFGLLVAQSALPWWMAPALSFAAYSGSAELLMVSMAASGTPLVTLSVTIFLVNARHLFYAFSFPLPLVKGRLGRLYSMYALVDEAYALTVSRPHGWTSPRILSMQVALQSAWVISGLIGVAIGTMLPAPIPGFEYALTAMFIALALDTARSRRDIPSVMLAALSALVTFFIFPEHWLISALLLFVASLVVRHFIVMHRGRPEVAAVAAIVAAEAEGEESSAPKTTGGAR